MATTWTKVDPKWQGPIKGDFQTADKVAGKPVPAAGFVWRREFYTADLYRYGKGLLTFDSLAGDRVLATTLTTTNGADSLTASGDPYLIKNNSVLPSPSGSGLWKEVKLAVRYGEWEEWETNP